MTGAAVGAGAGAAVGAGTGYGAGKGALLAASSALAVMLWSGPALAQGKAGCDERGKVVTQEKVEGQVVKVDLAMGRVSVREADGKVHEFQASPEALKDFKVGEKIEAKLREAPACK